MSGIKDKVVIITGASSGIGEATARVLAAHGARVVLGARRTDRLEILAAAIRAEGGSAIYQALDVTRRSQLEDIVALAKSRFGQVDVIVNNAGVMPLSMLDQLKVDEWDRMVDVNIKGALYGIAACLPVMQAQGNGQIINVASIGGHRVSPSAAVYCATKFAVRAISDGLRQELTNIRVTVISPGVTESELADSISDPAAKLNMENWRKIAISAESVARTILFAIEQPKDVDISEIIVRPTASPH
ncbi:MAG: SDR family oxidoreductase [Collimonas sp.]|uniref:SDR family oxidoreductase n=1 Tax=Collimonas sp. TaxID=1963772 RepID=UPI003263EF72